MNPAPVPRTGRATTRDPIVVTGMPRSGTSWVGRMLDASGQVVYINEPLNPEHPPGGSPGVLDAEIPHRFFYVGGHNGGQYEAPFRSMFDLRYGVQAELRRNRAPYDLARMVKYGTSFRRGRARDRRPLLDDPFAVFCLPWLIDTFSCRGVVVVRHPAAIIAGRKRLGYTVDFRELQAQEHLIHDYLSEFENELAAPPVDDLIANGCLLWKVIYHAVAAFRRSHPELLVVRHEDLSFNPVDEFRHLYADVNLQFTSEAEQTILEATTGSDPSAKASHAWSISRRGISRTGFRSMDSRKNAMAWKRTLSAEEIGRIRALTEPVADIFYRPDEWS